MLLTATTRPGEPYDDLEELYGRVLGQWVPEMNHVATIVGGFHSQQKHGGFLADVRKGIWSELNAAPVVVDAYRRNLQRAYLDLISERLNGRQAATDDQRATRSGKSHVD